MKINHLFGLLALMSTTAAAPAATVTFTLEYDPLGQFKLYADASLLDNFGLASYGVPLVAGSFLTIDHSSPNGFAPGLAIPVGFNSLRSANDANPIGASQDTISGTPASMVFGLGHNLGNLAAAFPGFIAGPGDQTAYAAHLLLATGTYDISGTVPCIETSSPDFGANVFDSGVSTTVIGATVNFVCVPEPGTWSLLGLGSLALVLELVRRRRGMQR